MEEYKDHVFEDLKINWRRQKDILLSDPNLPSVLLKTNLDGFTEFLSENPKAFTFALADELIDEYGKDFINDNIYYYILRVLHIIIENDFWYFTEFDDKYKDELFTRIAYESNPEVCVHFNKLHKIYISDHPIARLVCSAITTFKVFKESIKL